jgi:lysophospholipase L1-like esterase
VDARLTSMIVVRNGKTYLLPCLESHNPIDVVIIMLGTNDFKFRFNRSANDIAAALQGLVEMVNATVKNGLGDNTKIVLISPAHINVDAPRFMEFYGKDYDLESGTASTLLGKAIKDVALHAGCEFFDASEVAIVGEDGLHLNLESQARLAEKIAELVQ